MSPNPLIVLGQLGQSPWYDFITRELIASGELKRLIAEDGLRGMTSNPTIFEKAIAGSDRYDDEIRRLSADGRSPAEIFEALSVGDVRSACDAFRPLYDAEDGGDGLVSLEVSPTLANDTAGTIAEAERLWNRAARPNLMIKIPATKAGLPAIAHCIAKGININITLLFATERYREVIEAYLKGLEQRAERGLPLARIASVASFFVSRVDAKIDPLIDRLSAGAARGAPSRGTAAIANACEAYRIFEESLATSRWQSLSAKGAKRQRPLWASTSTKDPKYPDTYYVEALIAADTVNTIPPETFAAYRDHGHPEIRIQQGIAAAPAVFHSLAATGISLADVTRSLEEEGVAKFAASYQSLLKGIEAKCGALAGTA